MMLKLYVKSFGVNNNILNGYSNYLVLMKLRIRLSKIDFLRNKNILTVNTRMLIRMLNKED